jgi:hypothetical protein
MGGRDDWSTFESARKLAGGGHAASSAGDRLWLTGGTTGGCAGSVSVMGLMGIGEFARLLRLSPKALRLYDELGLLQR